MTEEEGFETAGALEAWLESKGVGERKAAEAAPVLFDKGFDSPSSLIGISSGDLKESGLSIPAAQTLSNKLAKPQQQDGHFHSLIVTSAASKKRKVIFKLTETNKRVKFCQSIRDAATIERTGEKELRSIEFSEPLLGDNSAGKTLYIRKCYEDLRHLIDRIKKENLVGGVVVTGTPGIGKTMFGVHLIHHFAYENKMTVLYKFRNEGYFIFTQKKTWKYEDRSYELPGDGPEYFGLIESTDVASSDFFQYLKNLETVLYIVDLHKESHNESLAGAFTIILSSCDKEKYASAVTSSTKTLSILWMPTWTKQEIKECFPMIDKLDERFNRHGGVLRYLLWPESQAGKDLNSVLDSSTAETFVADLEPNCKDAKISGRLVHYSIVEKDYTGARARFASKEIATRVATRFYLRERLSFQATIDKMKFDSTFGSPRGILSELVWHHQFRDGGNFRLKTFASGKTEAVVVPEFAGDVITCEYDMRDLSTLAEEDYVSPIDSTFPAVFPAVDAFYVTKKPFFDPQYTGDGCLIGLQMAGSKQREHWLKGPSVQKWIQHVKDIQTVTEVFIVFIVNNEDLEGWSSQSFKSKDKNNGKWQNYQRPPSSLARVVQLALGLPKEGRDHQGYGANNNN